MRVLLRSGKPYHFLFIPRLKIEILRSFPPGPFSKSSAFTANFGWTEE